MPESMSQNVEVYKIRRISDGLFSSGGTHPTFSVTGKTWKKINHVRCHITLVREDAIWRRKAWDYKGCEIVVGVYTLDVSKSLPIS